MTSSPTTPKRRMVRSRPRRVLRRSLVGLAVFALVIGIGSAAAYWKLNANIDSAALPASSIVTGATPKGALNVLFIGSDSRDLKTDEYGKATGSQRSDALLLVHFSRGNTRVEAIQIPRDTLTTLPACKDTGSGTFAGGTNLMINSALDGGPACSVRAVEKLTNVRIDHFIQLDFDGFADMVDALDGVGVCLDQPMKDVDAKLDLPAGKQTLDGEQALALARTRHAVGDGSDIGRLGHQQVVMSSIISRARSAGVLTRPDRLLKFLNALTSSITVDEGISSISKLSGLARRAQAVPDSKITFITMPNGAAPTDPNRVVKTPDADTIFNAVAKDRKVAVEDSTTTGSTGSTTPIRVLNASETVGLASQAQTALTGQGFVVSGVATAEAPSALTRIFVDGTPAALKTAKSINTKFGFKAEIVDKGSAVAGVWLVVGADRVTAGVDAVEPDPVKATSRTASDTLCS